MKQKSTSIPIMVKSKINSHSMKNPNSRKPKPIKPKWTPKATIIAGKKYLTINTDASYCSEHKVGGYAFWIKSERLTIKQSGAFKVSPDSSNDAELKCILNALHSVLNRKTLPTITTIRINTDCQGAIDKIKRNRDAISICINRYIQQINDVTGATELQIKHVKAHTLAQDSRSWVNEWCDIQAKEMMRKERKKKYLR